jgi:hypothetical protein
MIFAPCSSPCPSPCPIPSGGGRKSYGTWRPPFKVARGHAYSSSSLSVSLTLCRGLRAPPLSRYPSLQLCVCLAVLLSRCLSVCLSRARSLARSLARLRCDRAEVLEEGLGAVTAAEEAHLREGQAARPGVPKTQQTFLVSQGYMRPVLAFMGQVT